MCCGDVFWCVGFRRDVCLLYGEAATEVVGVETADGADVSGRGCWVSLATFISTRRLMDGWEGKGVSERLDYVPPTQARSLGIVRASPIVPSLLSVSLTVAFV